MFKGRSMVHEGWGMELWLVLLFYLLFLLICGIKVVAHGDELRWSSESVRVMGDPLALHGVVSYVWNLLRWHVQIRLVLRLLTGLDSHNVRLWEYRHWINLIELWRQIIHVLSRPLISIRIRIGCLVRLVVAIRHILHLWQKVVKLVVISVHVSYWINN